MLKYKKQQRKYCNVVVLNWKVLKVALEQSLLHRKNSLPISNVLLHAVRGT